MFPITKAHAFNNAFSTQFCVQSAVSASLQRHCQVSQNPPPQRYSRAHAGAHLDMAIHSSTCVHDYTHAHIHMPVPKCTFPYICNAHMYMNTEIYIYIKTNTGFVSGGRSALHIQPGCLPRRCEVFSRFPGREHEQQLQLPRLSSDTLVSATGLGLIDCVSLCCCCCCCCCHLRYLKTLPESLRKDKGVLFLKSKV